MQKQISDKAGTKEKEGLAKITISTTEGTLGSFVKDMNTLARMAVSAMNPGTYFQMKDRLIDQAKGTGSVDMYVQKSELKTAFNALSKQIGKWNGAGYTDSNGELVNSHEAQYDIKAQDINYVTGYLNLHGKKAQTRAKAEASAVAGGQLIPSPTEKNPDRYKFMLPAPDDIKNTDRDWVKQRRDAVFFGSMKFSHDEAVKLKQEKDEKELQRQINEVKKNKLETDRARAKNAREIQKLEALELKEKLAVSKEVEKALADEEKQKKRDEAKAQKEAEKEEKRVKAQERKYEKTFFNEDQRLQKEIEEGLAYWDRKEKKEEELAIAKKEKEQELHDKKEQQLYDIFRKAEIKEAEEKKKKEEKDKAKADADKAKKQKAEKRQEAVRQMEHEHLKHEELRKMRQLLGVIGSGIVILTDIARRILTTVMDFSTKQLSSTIEANALSVPVTAVRNFGYFEIAKGLERGTVAGTIKDFQTAFGDVTALDEKKLEILARVIGTDVEKMVRSGLGGENPAKLMELTFDKFFKQFLEGKNSLGQTVGQEQARRELTSVLNKISPQLGKIFSVATYQHTSGLNRDFSTWQEFMGTAPGTKALWFDQTSVNNVGEVINDIKAKLTIFSDDILTKLSLAMSGFADTVSNIRLGMNAETNLELNAKNRQKHKKYIERNTSAKNLARKRFAQKLKEDYDMELPDNLSEDNMLAVQDFALRFNEKQDVEAQALLSQILVYDNRIKLSEKELAKGPGEEVFDYPTVMSSENIASEVTERTRELYLLENAIDSDSSGNHLTERQRLTEGTYDTKTTKSAMKTLFENDDRVFFKQNDKGRWTWSEQADTEIGKGIIKALEKATKKKGDRLLQYLVSNGVDPVTLLGGEIEDIVLKAIEPYFGGKGYRFYNKAENAYFDKQEESIGAEVFATDTAIKEGLIPNIVHEANVNVDASYKDKQLTIIVNNDINGKKESKTRQFAVPNANTNNTFSFSIKSDEDKGSINGLQMTTGQ